MEEPPYITNLLQRYKIRDIGSFPALSDKLESDCLLASTLYFIIEGIEDTEVGVRQNIAQIVRMDLGLMTVEDRIARKKARGDYLPGERTLVHSFFAGENVPHIIRFCGYVLFEICNMWDLTANFLRCLYDVKLEEKKCRFPVIYDSLKSKEELTPFFDGLEIRLDHNGLACFSEDSVMKRLLEPRNRVAHSLNFSSVAAKLRAGATNETTICLYDPCKEGGKLVRILTFPEWKDRVAKSYANFVTNYCKLLETIDERTERLGGLRDEK